MKLLNPDRPSQMPKVYPRVDPPEMFEGTFDGRRVVYDTNDMSLYLMDDGDEEPTPSKGEIQLQPVFQPKPLGICLCVSDACNLRCDYCYVWPEAHVSKRVVAMDQTTIVRALDLLHNPGRRQITISMFGGEPLTAWPAITFAVERVEQMSRVMGFTVRFNLTTNGTLLDERKAEYLKRHNFGFIVSVDGGREHHDRHRKTAKGHGSYDRMLAGLHLLNKAGCDRVTLRGTFVPGEWEEVEERLTALNQLCDDGLGSSVALEPAALAEYGCTGHVGDYGPDEIHDWMKRGTTWAIERARAGKRVRWTYLQNTLARLRTRTPSFTECGAGAGYMSVSPDGKIHACHLRADGSEIGCVRWGIDEVARQQWLEPRLTAHKGCGDCWARRLCGGGCRAFNLKRNGDIHVPGELYCVLAKAKALQSMRTLIELRDDVDSMSMILGGGKAKQCECDFSAKQEA